MHNPIIIEPVPEHKPFIKTISRGSDEDIFLVQLFSAPQHNAANN